MAWCGLRRRVRTITCAAAAVATIIRLEVRAGAPGAAVPVVTGGSEAGLGAGVAGGRREPRPQQQNMYTGAGSQMHGGEYVQLTWLVSGSQVAMWCKAMGRSRAISKIDGAVRYFCLSDQQLLAHSAHFHRVTRSRRANRTGFARESSARIETSELAAQLLVVYDYRGEDTENEDSGATARRC